MADNVIDQCTQVGGTSSGRAPNPDHNAAGNTQNNSGLASMPDAWLYNVASWLLQHDRLALFRTCKANAEVVLSHPGCTPIIGRVRPGAWTPMKHVVACAVAMVEPYSKHSVLNMVTRDGFHSVDQATLSTVLTMACSLVGPHCQQLAAITTISCGGKRQMPWSLEDGLIPEFLVRLCPNLRTLHLQFVRIDSLPQPATDGAALDVHAKLHTLHLQDILIAEPITAALMSHQARRFPALTSLTATGFQTQAQEAAALAGLTTGLCQQLTYLKLSLKTSKRTSEWAALFFPASTVYPHLIELHWGVPDEQGSASILKNIDLALPALRRLYAHQLCTKHMLNLDLAWLRQLKLFSCTRLCLFAGHTPVVNVLARMLTCGGVHLTPGFPRMDDLPCVQMAVHCEFNLFALQYIHCSSARMAIDSWFRLGSMEAWVFGQRFACTYVRFEGSVLDETMVDLPRLMPGVSRFSSEHWHDGDASLFRDMAERSSRPVDVCIHGGHEPKHLMAQRLGTAMRRSYTKSLIRLYWEGMGGVVPC